MIIKRFINIVLFLVIHFATNIVPRETLIYIVYYKYVDIYCIL